MASNDEPKSLPASIAGEYTRKRAAIGHGTSSAFSSSPNPDEDWTKITDLAERRRMQNRIAQQNYREQEAEERLEDRERRAEPDSTEPPMLAKPDYGSTILPIDNNFRRTGNPRPFIGIESVPTYADHVNSVRDGFKQLNQWIKELTPKLDPVMDLSVHASGLLQGSAIAIPLGVSTGENIFQWAPRNVEPHFWKRAYMKATDYKRKAIQVVLNGKSYFARPDSGSDKNIMTETFAIDCGANIHRGEDDTGLFQMGTGQYIKSIGRALVPLKLLSGGESDAWCWFHIIPKCPVPLIMGAEFLRKIQLFTKNKHLLVECPFSFGSIPALKWIGSPQGKLCFFANHQLLTGSADTGSDLDLMSLDCAESSGFKIDKRHCSRSRVMLANETVVETIGQVHISSVQLPGFSEDFNMSFHVLPNLVCDVIFGEEFLEQTDAFNTCNIVDSIDPFAPYSLNPFINLGPLQSFLSRRSISKTSGSNTLLEQHDGEIEAELYRRNKAHRAILKMNDECRVEEAKAAEEMRRKAFNLKHVRCVHCCGIAKPKNHNSRAMDEPTSSPGRVP